MIQRNSLWQADVTLLSELNTVTGRRNLTLPAFTGQTCRYYYRNCSCLDWNGVVLQCGSQRALQPLNGSAGTRLRSGSDDKRPSGERKGRKRSAALAAASLLALRPLTALSLSPGSARADSAGFHSRILLILCCAIGVSFLIPKADIKGCVRSVKPLYRSLRLFESFTFMF